MMLTQDEGDDAIFLREKAKKKCRMKWRKELENFEDEEEEEEEKEEKKLFPIIRIDCWIIYLPILVLKSFSRKLLTFSLTQWQWSIASFTKNSS